MFSIQPSISLSELSQVQCVIDICLSLPHPPGLSVPRAPYLSVPLVPGLSVPRAPYLSVPRAPYLSVPRVPGLSLPRAPSLIVLSVYDSLLLCCLPHLLFPFYRRPPCCIRPDLFSWTSYNDKVWICHPPWSVVCVCMHCTGSCHLMLQFSFALLLGTLGQTMGSVSYTIKLTFYYL